MGKAKNLLFTACLEHFGQIRPDSHIWLFSSTDNSHYNYNSRYLFEYVKENLPEITPLFVINDPELRNSLSSKYGKQYFIETEVYRVFVRHCQPVYGLHLPGFLPMGPVFTKRD